MQQAVIGSLQYDTRVYKEECVYCFENVRAGGVNVCLGCFNCYCDVHAVEHAQRHDGHTLALHILQVREEVEPEENENAEAEEPAQKLTKLAIGVEGGAQMENLGKWRTDSHLKRFPEAAEEKDASAQAAELAKRILDAQDVGNEAEAKAWEMKLNPCEHTLTLQQEEGKRAGKTCGQCDLVKPMWLCLTCGNLGCGRPLPPPMTAEGGNGHALEHHRDNPTHPLVCKLGTVTPDGKGDVYCYACNDDVLDEQLAQHLGTFGILASESVKTEMSMQELSLEQNKLMDLLSTEDEHTLEQVQGPGLTGLRNIGNTCYMNSVLQALLAVVPEGWPSRYSAEAVAEHHKACASAEPARCWGCQTGKLVRALLEGSDPIQPRMWKGVATRGTFFAGVQQQDSFEFFQHLLKKLRENEGAAMEALLSFDVGVSVRCLSCGGERRSLEKNTQQLSLPLALHACQPPLAEAPEKETAAERMTRQYKSATPFEASLKEWNATEHIEGFRCGLCKEEKIAAKTQSLSSFPSVLVVHMCRFALENWTPQKLSVAVSGLAGTDAPAVMDLSFLATPPEDPSVLKLPEEEASSSSSAERADEAIVAQLEGMGFPRVRCERAAFATGNSGAEAAMNYLFEHTDDPSLDVPLNAGGGGGGGEKKAAAASFDPMLVVQLTSMGFGEAAALHALRECDGNVERCVDWLFSHPEAGTEAPSAPAQAEQVVVVERQAEPPGPKLYQLQGFILHKGNQITSGHYVAYAWNAERSTWIVYDDERVSLSVKPPIDQAYMYIFRRVKQ